jgi:hypothetical protein
MKPRGGHNRAAAYIDLKVLYALALLLLSIHRVPLSKSQLRPIIPRDEFLADIQ